jgi:hypothetical protein
VNGLARYLVIFKTSSFAVMQHQIRHDKIIVNDELKRMWDEMVMAHFVAVA